MTTRIRVVEIETDEPGALSEALRPTVTVTPALPAPEPQHESTEADEGGGDMADATGSAAVVERPSSPAAVLREPQDEPAGGGPAGAVSEGGSAPPVNGHGAVRPAPLLKCGKRHWPNSREHRIGCMGETARQEPTATTGAVAGEKTQLRPCPRCEKGQLIVTNHGAGVERECLQCGYTDNGLGVLREPQDERVKEVDERSRKRQPSSGGMRL